MGRSASAAIPCCFSAAGILPCGMRNAVSGLRGWLWSLFMARRRPTTRPEGTARSAPRCLRHHPALAFRQGFADRSVRAPALQPVVCTTSLGSLARPGKNARKGWRPLSLPATVFFWATPVPGILFVWVAASRQVGSRGSRTGCRFVLSSLAAVRRLATLEYSALAPTRIVFGYKCMPA